MRTLFVVLCFCMTHLLFAQNAPKKTFKKAKKQDPISKLRHVGVYAGCNVNSLENEAFRHLSKLYNNSHAVADYKIGYTPFLRMNGWSGGMIGYVGKVFADIGFNTRKSSQTARFADIVNEFQSKTLSMNSFNIGVGVNMGNPSEKVLISPGLAFGMGRLIIKETTYRTEQDLPIPASQSKPIGVPDDSKSMSSLNMYGSAFVNITVGNMKKFPKVIVQPYVTLPLIKNDLTKAHYPSDFKGSDPALKTRINYWGVKFAIAL